MMRVPRFRYHAPRSLSEASGLLEELRPGAVLLAGGTDLVPNLKRRQQAPAHLVSVRGLNELRGLETRPDGSLRLGASLTLAELGRHPVVRSHQALGALERAAGQVATPLIRAMATLGGNLCLDTRCSYYDQPHEWRKAIDFCMKAPAQSGGLAVTTPTGPAGEPGSPGGVCWVAPGSPRCWAVSSTDLAPALIALGAEVTLVSRQGQRRIPLTELYADDGMAYLRRRPDEILSGVHLGASVQALRSTYWKLRRRQSFDFPVLSIGAAVELSSSGEVQVCRVVLGAVASHPLVIDEAGSLVGARLTDDAIERVAEAAMVRARPMDNTDLTLGWRKKVTRELVAGALRELRGDDPRTFGLLARRAAFPPGPSVLG